MEKQLAYAGDGDVANVRVVLQDDVVYIHAISFHWDQDDTVLVSMTKAEAAQFARQILSELGEAVGVE